MTAALLFEARHPAPPPPGAYAEAEAYHRYLVGRSRYRAALLDDLTRRATDGGGPVLEVSGGYGSVGRDLARAAAVPVLVACPDGPSRAVREQEQEQEQKQAAEVEAAADDPTLIDDAEAEPMAPFPLVVSVNHLHRAADAAALLVRLRRLAGARGTVVVNDVRRDADPFIVEWVLRDMEKDRSPQGVFALRCFVTALRSAFTLDDLRALSAAAGLAAATVAPEGPITATLRLDPEG
jgi:SAM-dependent methyltransferase